MHPLSKFQPSSTSIVREIWHKTHTKDSYLLFKLVLLIIIEVTDQNKEPAVYTCSLCLDLLAFCLSAAFAWTYLPLACLLLVLGLTCLLLVCCLLLCCMLMSAILLAFIHVLLCDKNELTFDSLLWFDWLSNISIPNNLPEINIDSNPHWTTAARN
jgi:hypothetical protein